MHVSCFFGRTKTVKHLLAKGAKVNQARTTDNVTPLLLAVKGGHEKIVKMLLSRGADVAVAQNDGRTPLSAAIQGTNKKIVKLLQKYGAEFVKPSDDIR